MVLDEAHYIRRRSNIFYRSVADLKARSRWCLTGTPVQNRLEDIGCLFAFLRMAPFNNLSVFRKFIAKPFDQIGQPRTAAITAFTKLLDSACLRRTTEGEDIMLNRKDTVRHVELTTLERQQYTMTREIMGQAVRNLAGELETKSALSLFQIQLQLRILCNHGTWQPPFSWTRRSRDRLDEIEAGIELNWDSRSEVACKVCAERFPASSCSTLYRQYSQVCKHVICMRCIERALPVITARV